jgi:hypothetical protein
VDHKQATVREPGIKIRGDWIFTYSDGTVIKRKNLVVQSGLEFLAALFVGEQSPDTPIFIALGTGTQAASSTDGKLRVEGIRKGVTFRQRQLNVVRLRAFFLAIEANGDWQEFGVFVAATDVTDSGILFNRLVTPISKASNQVMSIECRLTFSV